MNNLDSKASQRSGHELTDVGCMAHVEACRGSMISPRAQKCIRGGLRVPSSRGAAGDVLRLRLVTRVVTMMSKPSLKLTAPPRKGGRTEWLPATSAGNLARKAPDLRPSRVLPGTAGRFGRARGQWSPTTPENTNPLRKETCT